MIPAQAASAAGRVDFGIDWYAFTVKDTAATPVLRAMERVLGSDWEASAWLASRRGDDWERRAGPLGSLLEINSKDSWVHVQLKGRACAAVGTELLVALHRALRAEHKERYRAKRIDLAWDDYSRELTPGEFRSRFWDPETNGKRPEVVCRAKKGHAREDDSPERGNSYQVGERCSNRMLRIYDKGAQSGGQIDAIRFELECKNRVAQGAISAVAEAVGNRSAAALRFLVGFVDFIEGDSRGRRRRCAWWQRLVGAAEAAALSPAERGTLDEWREDYTRQNSSGFRLLVALNGGDVGAAARELRWRSRRDNPRHARWTRELAGSS